MTARPHERHREAGPKRLSFVLVTVSSSRFEQKEEGREPKDESGDAALRAATRAGHTVVKRELVSDEKEMIERQVREFLSGQADVLVLMGGTGVSRRDVTIEAVRPFFEKELDGFGELLRVFSLKQVGAAAVATRATAGVANGKLIVCLPGSPHAVRLAMRRFIGEFPHLILVARS